MEYGGMGFSKVEPDYIDLNHASMQKRNIIIEVVVIDMTRPLKVVYQFNKDTPFTSEELKDIKSGAYFFNHDSFTPIGEVKSIDKKSRQIILVDENTITYHYLIIVTGERPTNLSYEFFSGLQALVDALRLNSSVTEKLIPPRIQQHDFNLNITLLDEHDQKIQSLGSFAMKYKKPEQATVLVSELNKKLFQVQI